MGRFLRYLMPEFAALPGGRRCRVLDSYGPPRFATMPFHFIGAAGRLAVELAGRRVGILHLHMASHGSVIRKAALGLMAQAAGVPVVVHIHAAGFDDFMEGLPGPMRRLLAAWLGRCSRVVVIGSHWRRYLVFTLGLPPAKVALVHNGVPDPGTAAPPLGGGGRPLRILSLGELGPRKGTPELIATLAGPALKRLDWRAVIAGNGAVDQARALVEAAGLERRVSLPGWVDGDEARRLMAECDIFVLPSRQEGLPIAILEAMAMGRPVISTPVGAIPDAVVPERTGLLVQPGQVDELASALARLIEDGPLRRRCGEGGRQAYLEHFTIRHTARRLDQLYTRISQGSRRPERWASQPGE